ncbi:AraC family transcriptional regulator [Streptomyces sp. TRM66268-LWL]|uniref:AraC family transcriptional regulator n=1 Tax=Streptomyces polyasparticus TaxID=2767826 RepID=A0ABR7S740_9ACTN|nr:AraC family transcriptional regulator [Streptomyces polyasparticus]MBC9711291.1 AraC family transcriptional regulator [Streptomyces polyasparticus]
MDVLSDVLAVIRTGRPRAAHVRWHAPWAQEFASVPGSAGFQIVLEGSCLLLPPEGEPVRLAAGDVLLMPHGSGHTLADSSGTPPPAPACEPDDPRYATPYAFDSVDPTGSRGPATVVLCGTYQLDPRRTHPLLLGLPERIHLPAGAGRPSELGSAVELLAAELGRPRLGSGAAVPALLETLLTYILRIWFAEQPARGNATGWVAALNDPQITAALDAIHGAPGDPWTVASLAGRAGLSRAPFARRFAALTGQPPLTYLTWWRMTTAARLLQTTDAPLKPLAAQVGYASEFAFAAAFKRAYGVPPGRYRRAGTAGARTMLL